MALKKGMFESYVKERETTITTPKSSGNAKYSYNRVFDEPESLKKVLGKQDLSPVNAEGYDLEVELPIAPPPQSVDTDNNSNADTAVLENIPKEYSKSPQNYTQTTHKLHTNYIQQSDTNLTQTTHNELRTRNLITQSKHEIDSKSDTKKPQTTHKPNTNLTQKAHISTLVGVQRFILFFIFEECKKARSHITEPLSIMHIATSLKVAPGSIKTSISRLCDKSFLIVNSFKNGRGGWSSYEVPDYVYNELLQMEIRLKLHTNLTQTTHKADSKLDTQPNTTTSSSSSLNNIKTTTDLPEEWNFDITEYAKFGFTRIQIKQLIPLNVISAIEVEQSLIEFTHDLENNMLPSIRSGKINFLMGLFRSGSTYVSESYKSEQEAMILEMGRRASVKKKMLLNAKFTAWEGTLDGEQKKKISNLMPPALMVLEKTYGINNEQVKDWYFNYFVTQNDK